MYRASTPTLTFKLNTDVSRLEKILITFTQNNEIVLEKNKGQLECSGDKVSFTLTQEEANLFNADTAKFQVKLKIDGKVIPSRTYTIDVKKVLNDEVM